MLLLQSERIFLPATPKGNQVLVRCRRTDKIMSLRDVTRSIINRVQTVSGCPVVVSEDASLKTLEHHLELNCGSVRIYDAVSVLA